MSIRGVFIFSCQSKDKKASRRYRKIQAYDVVTAMPRTVLSLKRRRPSRRQHREAMNTGKGPSPHHYSKKILGDSPNARLGHTNRK